MPGAGGIVFEHGFIGISAGRVVDATLTRYRGRVRADGVAFVFQAEQHFVLVPMQPQGIRFRVSRKYSKIFVDAEVRLPVPGFAVRSFH
ncbi:hypothetical protein D3C87_1738880 [compost metagenome]